MRRQRWRVFTLQIKLCSVWSGLKFLSFTFALFDLGWKLESPKFTSGVRLCWVIGQLLELAVSQHFNGGQIYEFTKRNFNCFFFSSFPFLFRSLFQTAGDDFSLVLVDGKSHEFSFLFKNSLELKPILTFFSLKFKGVCVAFWSSWVEMFLQWVVEKIKVNWFSSEGLQVVTK